MDRIAVENERRILGDSCGWETGPMRSDGVIIAKFVRQFGSQNMKIMRHGRCGHFTWTFLPSGALSLAQAKEH